MKKPRIPSTLLSGIVALLLLTGCSAAPQPISREEATAFIKEYVQCGCACYIKPEATEEGDEFDIDPLPNNPFKDGANT